MSSPIFDSTFGTGRFRREEPMTTSGKPSPEPQNVRETPGEIARKLAVIELGVSDETFIGKIAAAIRAALAQSDAGPPPLRYSDKVERAGDGTETRRLELTQPDAEPVAWQLVPKEPTREMLNAGDEQMPQFSEADKHLTGFDVCQEIWRDMLAAAPTTPPRPAGLIEAAELVLAQVDAGVPYLRDNLASRVALNKLAEEVRRARAADRSVHGEPIPDCPTDGVAARQGNGG